MQVLMLIGLVVTVIVWVNFGWVWGLVSGVFLVGGLGWAIMFGLAALVTPGRKDKKEMVDAWEARAGEMRFGQPSTHPPRGTYQGWKKDRERTGESAFSWLDRVMGVAPGAPAHGYRGQATDAAGRTLYPWQGDEFAELRHELRAVKEPGGGLAWQELHFGDVGYFESIAFVLNKQVGWSEQLGRDYLKSLADGVEMQAAIEQTVAFLTGSESGRILLRRLRGEEATEDAARDLAAAGIGQVWALTGAQDGYAGASDLASLALADRLTAQRIKEVPPEYLPEAIAGFGRWR